MRRFLALIIASLLVPAAAQAATVRVDGPGDAELYGYGFDDRFTDRVYYDAAPGERNRLTVAYADDVESVTVIDPGAVIDAGESCEAIDAHSARCFARSPRAPFLQAVQARLGDLDDEVHATNGGVVALGGPGDDLLDGGPRRDVLDGGGGRDVLLGRGYDDLLTDGDRSSGRGAAGPGSDVLDGGEDDAPDLLSYSGRTRGVTVDLLRTNAGERGERDKISGFEDVAGGSGPDRIAGSDEHNKLFGGAESDDLSGRGGETEEFTLPSDHLEGGDGRDRISGDDGPDRIVGGRGLDSVLCGDDEDVVVESQAGELLEPACEIAFWSERFPDEGFDVRFSPHPLSSSATAIAFRIPCVSSDYGAGPVIPCEARVVLREAFGRKRLLGSGRLENKDHEMVTPTRVRLTTLGRRLRQRRGGVAATFALPDYYPRPIAWSIRLTR